MTSEEYQAWVNRQIKIIIVAGVAAALSALVLAVGAVWQLLLL